MSERIQLLKQQAGIDDNPDQEGLDQFAELIVRECINVISESREVRQTAYYYRNRVAEHFGVKK